MSKCGTGLLTSILLIVLLDSLCKGTPKGYFAICVDLCGAVELPLVFKSVYFYMDGLLFVAER